jgi:hypothetical protein
VFIIQPSKVVSSRKHTLCLTRKNLGVSRLDRFVKCAVVFNVPCKRSRCTLELCPAWPMWNPVEQRPVPLHPGHCPLSPLAKPLGIWSTCSFQEGWTSSWLHEQPNPESMATGPCVCKLFFISNPVIPSFGTPPMIYPCSYFSGLINHTME